MSGSNGERDGTEAGRGDRGTSPGDDGTPEAGDTFGVGIHVTDAEFQFVVHVPSDIDAGWTDPEAFQRVVERAVWERLDRAATLRGIGERAATGETVTLGRITLMPDGTVLDSEFSAAGVES
jgi:hypothetical protein